MKNRIYSKTVLGAAAVLAVSFTACSDTFLEDKKNYDNVSSEVYDYYSGANGRLNELYRICSPNIQAGGSQIWQYTSMGMADDHSKSTEEYAGFGSFVDPQVTMNTMTGTRQAPDYFQGSSQYATYGRIREINDVIAGVTNGKLSADQKEEILGQAYFFRAWCYFSMVRYCGGVPIVKEVMQASPSSVVPRSTTKQCIDFICEDLDKAAEMLKPKTGNGQWLTGDNYGRVTTGTALALKGRVLLYWASPLFNRDNNPERWETAYSVMKEAKKEIDACGYGLGRASDPGVNGSGWAHMFLDISGNTEGVWVTLYNKEIPDQTPDYQRNNLWEQGARPANTLGNNGKTPTSMIVDLFPMKDGKRPAQYQNGLEASQYTYDPQFPFIDRDPRFYRTFAFPGEYWRFNGDPNTAETCNPYKGDEYILWNYVWYNDPAKYDDPQQTEHFGADNLLGNVHGMYVRKFSDDLDVNGSPNYDFSTGGKSVGFRCCKTSTMEIRYAEVLLNLAEAACMTGNMPEAVEYLKKIRERVGYTGDCGLDAGLASSQSKCMAAILYERQIEFAYEGKRFEDMRRWLLFDGGVNFGSVGAKQLTGWGGNTCTWLGVQPFNDQRRDNMEFRLVDELNYADGKSGKEWERKSNIPAERDIDNPDPIIGGKSPKMSRKNRDAYAVDLSEKLVKSPLVTQLDKLKEFYSTYLVRKTTKGDSYDSSNTPLKMNFRPHYYILGLTQGAQANNPTLEQNQGWEDYNNGGANGTFDPTADE